MAQLVPVDHDPFEDQKLAATMTHKAWVPDTAQKVSGALMEFGKETAGSIWDAVQAPGQAFQEGMQGDFHPGVFDYDEKTLGRAGNMAGLMAGGASPFIDPAAKDTLGIFAGAGAKTADHAKLATAKDMLAKGADKEAIWKQTGWFQGADKKWRFEIPDDDTYFYKKENDVYQSLDHPELYKGYPDTANIAVEKLAPFAEHSGVYYNFENARLANKPGETIEAEDKSTLLHELQHGIQEREGFAKGGNPQTTRKFAIETLKDYPPPEHLDALERIKYVNKLADEAYRRLAGEVESRNVEYRLKMSPAERQAKPPWTTEDRPRDKQTVIGVKRTPVDHDPFAK